MAPRGSGGIRGFLDTGTDLRRLGSALCAVNGLPDALYPPAWVVTQLGAFGAVPAAAAGLVLARTARTRWSPLNTCRNRGFPGCRDGPPARILES